MLYVLHFVSSCQYQTFPEPTTQYALVGENILYLNDIITK